MNIEEMALYRVNLARSDLIQSRRFYGVLVSHVEPVISRRFPTAATDGKRHYWNPEFVMRLSQNELLGVQAHECEHDARHHGTRRGSREPVEWNVSADYSINQDLIAEGFTLPKDALIDPRYAGMASEDIYRMRELDRQQPQPEQPDADEDEGDEQPGDEADTNPGQKPGEDEAQDGQDEAQDGSDGGEGDEPGDDGEASDGDPGDQQGSVGGTNENESSAKGDGNDGGEDAGDEAGGDGDGDAGEGKGEGEGQSSGPGEGDEGEGGSSSSSDPGGCGEVLDSVTDDGEAAVAEDDAKWERVVRQAASMAKAVGQLPGHVAREIERANNPPRDWRNELREFCEQGGLRIETWNRPNRRFIGRGLILPSTQKDGVSKAVFIIDTSGSCDAIALALVQNEAQAMLDDGIIDEVVAVYGDVRVTRVDEYRTGDDIEFDPKGGGGTDMGPLFRFVADEHDDATLIVCFTDLLFYTDCGPEPLAPVLFAVHGYPQRVRDLIARGAPWDAKAIDVGAH